MKTTNLVIAKYEADEGYVFDWKEPRYMEDENGNQVQEHLYAKVLFIGRNDIIDNYVEVEHVEDLLEEE